jgi:integrase
VSWKKVETPNGDRWIVRWRDGGRGTPGHQKRFLNERDARLFDASITRAKHLGQLASEVLGSEQTVAEFVSEWWEKYAEPYLKPGTLASYAYVLDRWIVAYLGRLRLRDVTRETIMTYVRTLQQKGAGAPTVNRCLGILQGVFQRAVEWNRLAANPFAGVPRLGHKRSKRIDAHTPEEVERIRSVHVRGKELTRQARALVSVLAYEGLRFGEAAALQWGDAVDHGGFPREWIRLVRGLSDHVESTTKSGHERGPELFKPVAQELVELYVSRGRPPLNTLVFPDRRGGYLRRQNFRRRVWIPALAAAWPCQACSGTGLDRRGDCCEACRIEARSKRGSGSSNYFRPHDLRHTCGTLLIYAGWTVNEVAEHLGHADPGFTARTYAHVFRDARGRRVPIEEAIAKGRRPDEVLQDQSG